MTCTPLTAPPQYSNHRDPTSHPTSLSSSSWGTVVLGHSCRSYRVRSSPPSSAAPPSTTPACTPTLAPGISQNVGDRFAPKSLLRNLCPNSPARRARAEVQGSRSRRTGDPGAGTPLASAMAAAQLSGCGNGQPGAPLLPTSTNAVDRGRPAFSFPQTSQGPASRLPGLRGGSASASGNAAPGLQTPDSGGSDLISAHPPCTSPRPPISRPALPCLLFCSGFCSWNSAGYP